MTSHDSVQRFVADNFTTSWFYPIKGVYFFLFHRSLLPLLRARLIPLTLLSTVILGFLFLTTYLPQVALLLLFHSRGSAWVNGTFLVLGEANLLVALLFESFLVDATQVDVFDSVLVLQGRADLVRNRRPVTDETAGGSDGAGPGSLGPREKGAVFAPFSLRQIVEFVLLLPLNFVPYAGVPLFLFLTGYRAGPLLHHRYHALKGWSKRDVRGFVKSKGNRWRYAWFGTVAMALQLVPVLSMFFLITTSAGSALLAVKMEELAAGRDDDGSPTEDSPPFED